MMTAYVVGHGVRRTRDGARRGMRWGLGQQRLGRGLRPRSRERPARSATLTGSVGPGFEISMVKTRPRRGTYTLTVDDKASDHNFHLTGLRRRRKTDVARDGHEDVHRRR